MQSIHIRSVGSFCRKSPASRVSPQQTRYFHPTSASPFLEAASGFVYGIHSLTGLPWAYSLPLTALTVRMLVAMPLQIYTRRQARKERWLAPIVHSWMIHARNEISRKGPQSSDPLTLAMAIPKLNRLVKDRREAVFRKFKVPRFYKAANFLQIPVWISIMESIRNMCGDDRGLLRLIASVIRNWFHPGDALKAMPLEAEPSLMTEGAFWFPDLIAGDPTGALPALLTASIIMNIRTGWKTDTLREISDLPRSEMILKLLPVFLKGLLNTLALYIGYSAWAGGLPSALMLYWVTSTNTATLQTIILDKYVFAKAPLKLWKETHIGLRRTRT